MTDEKDTVSAQSLSLQQISPGMIKVDDDFFTVFSNVFRVSASPTEFRLVFGDSGPRPTGEMKIVDLFEIVVTPAQAKFIAENLGKIVEQIETQFGTISTLQSLVDRKQQLQSEPHQTTDS